MATPGEWTLYLYSKVDTRELPKAPDLEVVLNAAKQAGRLIAPYNCPSDVARIMHLLGIEAASYRDAEDSTGTVRITGGTTGP